jgi:hypothetical protein
MQPSHRWLIHITWDRITEINRAMCQAKSLTPGINTDHARARQLWERAHGLETSLLDAVQLCRKCNDRTPFLFNCGNTFAAVGGELVASWVAALPMLEARMLDQAVKHYINGKIGLGELQATLNHAGRVAAPPAPAAAHAPPAPATAPSPARLPAGSQPSVALNA